MRWLRKLRSLIRRDKLEAEMGDEMRHHVELQTTLNIRAGMDPEDARYAALRQFGNVAGIQEQAREQRFRAPGETLARDAVYAVRQWRKKPAATVIMLMTLALGIGANTAIYSLVQGVVLRPLPIKDQARVVQIEETNLARNVDFFSVSLLNFVDWRERSQSFETMVGVAMRGVTLTGLGVPEQLAVSYVSEGYFSMLGRPLLQGRDFRGAEDRPGANQVVILSEAFWRGRFGARPDAIGQTLTLRGKPHTIVGVAPRDPGLSGRGELFVPLGADLKREERDNHEIDVYGRLRPGISREQAEIELNAVAAQLAQEHPVTNEGWGVRLTPLADAIVAAPVRLALFTLLGAVGLLLLNTSANLSSLQLARAVSRDRELTIRAALGGSKGRIARQLLTENLLLSLLGGAAGIGLAHWLVAGWRASSFASALPRADEVGIDGGVMAFTLVISVLVGTLTGLAPVWRANRLDLRHALNQGGRAASGGRHRALRGLVLAQIALSFVLLAAAGVLLRSFQKLTQVDLGFVPQGVLTLKLAPGDGAKRFFTQLTERVGALPGVQSVGVGSGVPLESFNTSVDIQPAGAAEWPAGKALQSEWRIVRENYFEALGVPLRRGRLFTAADAAPAPKTILLNETAARLLWGDHDPVGRFLHIGGTEGTPSRVIGVVGDVRSRHPGRPPAPAIYLSGYRDVWGNMTLVVKTTLEPASLLPQIRREVNAINPQLPLYAVKTMDAAVAESLGEARLLATLLAAFAALALVLAILGVAGVTSFLVAERTREIGIRIALGAQRTQVLGLIVRENLRVLVTGLGAGLLVFAASARFIATQLYELAPWDSLSLVAAGGMLLLAGLAAALLPARRAAKVDPTVALRAE
jgi:putative ABC transport system permease protein